MRMTYWSFLIVLSMFVWVGCANDSQPTIDSSSGTDVLSMDVVSPNVDMNSNIDISPDTAPPVEEAEACPTLDESIEVMNLYYHQVKKAVINDPTTFVVNSTVLLDHASVPDAILRNDGEIWVYVINGQPGQHGIFVAKMGEDELFEVFDCVRINGKLNGNAVDPDIVQLADGRYRLFYYVGWFTGNGGPPPDEPHPMYSAISEDGIHFTDEQLLMEIDGGGTDPTAAQMPDGSWFLAYAHPDGVQLAWSEDGSAFANTGQSFNSGIPEIHRFEDGTLRLYVTGMDGLTLWRSDDDGGTWAEEASAPMGGADPSLVKTGEGEWTLFVKTMVPKDQRP